MKEQILELNKQGKKVKEIATELNIWESQVRYWLDENYRKKHILNVSNYKKKWSKEKREKYNQSRREYNRNYNNRKYREDKVWREKVKAKAREYSKRRSLI